MQMKDKFAGRRAWFRAGASALALLGASAAAVPAYAQIENITVTAQRRAENIQEVPISVSTLSGEKFDSLFASGDDILSLALRVPGLYAESSNGRAAPRFYIRGLGNVDFDLAASQPVSIIVDEVVLENVTLKASPIYDIEQVEVLRGPQGTLFGRNTPAGIVKFTTVKPSHELDYYATASLGEYMSSNLQGAVGGSLSPDKVAGRLSFMRQSRDNWIDNTFNGEEIGGFEETAARLQLLFSPTDALDILTNIHGRNLTGRSAIAFRGNILSPGSNDLNANYDRDTVSYDGGGNNAQSYEGWGGSVNASLDFNGVTLTSITAFERMEGKSRGDIDGTSGPYTFNFGGGPYFAGEIPFSSDTQDAIDLEQITQEFRLASAEGGALFWQVGAYYFTSEFDVTTTGFAFPPETTVTHMNDLWAVFGQASYDLTDRFTGVAGIRYTDDSKDLETGGANVASADDGQVSWDVSALYDVNETVNIYARVASGFRGPSIQGRDIAFFGAPTTAESETVLSYEAGFKAQTPLVRLNGAVFFYTVEDQQFSIIGGVGNFNQVTNADEGQGYGFELDAEFNPVENFDVTAGISYNNTEIKDSSLAIAPCPSACTVLDPVNPGDPTQVLIDGNPFPQAPEWTGNFTARYAIPYGNGEFFAFTDWTYQGDTNFFLYESTEFSSDGNFEGGLRLGYAYGNGRLEGALFARNITDEDNLKGGIDFNNLTGFVNEPRVVGVSLTLRN